MRIYEAVYKWSLVFFSVPAVFALIDSMSEQNIYVFAYWALTLSIVWIAYSFLTKRRPYSLLIASLTAAVVLINFSIPLFLRVRFLIENNGRMELADGRGSPLAFIVGMITQIYFVLPFLIITFTGIIVLFYQRREVQ